MYSEKTYKFLSALKIGLMVAAAIGIMLLLCGMVVRDNSPIAPLQLVVMSGIGTFALIALIYLYVSDKGSCEKQGINKNSNYRRKAK